MSRPDYRAHFLEGVAHFNAHEFWEAHESWEELWLAAESDVEQFLQGMIQLAAAYHHVRRGTFPGAVRLFDAALRRLEAFPETFSGVDRSAAAEAARRHRAWTAALLAEAETEKRLDENDFPKLTLVDDAESPLPPRDAW